MIGVVILLVLLGCILVFPKWLAPDLSDESLQGIKVVRDRLAAQGDRSKLQNDVRTSLLQGLGGAALLAGLFFTWYQFNAQQDLMRQGQIADRFTRAVDQLANTGNLDVRLGGIYGLEQVARDAHDDRTRLAVYEVLTAYVRRHAIWDPNSPALAALSQLPVDPSIELQRRAPDVQAVMTVLGRRAASDVDPPLHLSAVDLRNANLFDAHLEGAKLSDAHLEGGRLFEAHLKLAVLEAAHLERADLLEAHLEGAFLMGAHLEKALLGGAHLEWADLSDAHLEGTQLDTALSLEKAHLKGAHGDHDTRWPAGFDWKAAGVIAD